MKAIRIAQYGGPEVLQLQHGDLLEPKAGEVRVRVRAAGVNFVDVYQRRGEFFPPTLPGVVNAHESPASASGIGESITRTLAGETKADYALSSMQGT